jgi:threonine dehydrogenase-like Zn-dependent dehydrogenase
MVHRSWSTAERDFLSKAARSALLLPALMPMVTDTDDPLGVVGFATHHLPLEQAPHGYDMFRNKADGCIKVVLQP